LRDIEQDPRACSPRDIPDLVSAASETLPPLAAIMTHLAGADLDAGRRAQLEHAAGDLDNGLMRLAHICHTS
jgi:hypothetical protein